MIISASRRTDLPAQHAAWFLNRLKAGEVLVRNPFRPAQLSRIPLTPELVDCIVFWSKNPASILPLLPAIDAMAYQYYFQFTLTPYGADLEPGLPPKRDLMDCLLRLSGLLGPDRVIWRYDPVILWGGYSVEFHTRSFHAMANALKGAVRRCVFSFFDNYAALGKTGKEWAAVLTPSKMDTLAQAFSASAAACGMELVTCAEKGDYGQYGIRHGACIDRQWIEKLLRAPLSGGAAKGQRPDCGCMESVDIGAYGTCGHGCRYCYARQGKRLHTCGDASPVLDGWPGPADKIIQKEYKSLRRGFLGQVSLLE